MTTEPPLSPPQPIVPDSKDWTWVLEQPCPDCGFDCAALDVASTGEHVREIAEDMGALLAHPAASLRPAPTTWSAVEYGCHVRDVFRRFDARLGLMLDEDDPLFANWDQDATAIEDGYATQEATIVSRELADAAAAIAARFDELGDPATPEAGAVWQRVGRRSDGAAFTVDTFARYFLHDPVHHLWDIEQGYATINS